jgi:hypothetical protein
VIARVSGRHTRFRLYQCVVSGVRLCWDGGTVDLGTQSLGIPRSVLPPAGVSSKHPPGFQLLELRAASLRAEAVRLEVALCTGISFADVNSSICFPLDISVLTYLDSWASKVRGNGLDDQTLIPGKGNDFSLYHRVETVSEPCAAFCLIHTRVISVMIKRPER